MKNLLKRKALASVLSLAMILNLGFTPVMASAVEGDVPLGTSSVCPHHVHDEDCGYTEGVDCNHEHTDECYKEMAACTHEHTADCYPVVDSGEEATPTDAAKPTECSHVCSEESGCIKKVLDCQHQHDDVCGYVAGTPCTFDPADCPICNPVDSGGAQEQCSCAVPCTGDAINPDCPFCSAEGADLSKCIGEAPMTLEVGGTFTSTTTDGHELTYKILTESGGTGTVQVGTGIFQYPSKPNAMPDGETGSGSLTIPQTVQSGGVTYTVTAIGQYAFYSCTGFTDGLTIPESVTTIGTSAFSRCTFTGKLTIPGAVTTIRDFAFFNCSGFTGDLAVPDSVTSIEQNAFDSCSGFDGALTLGTSASASQLLTIGPAAFQNCKFTGDLVIPNKVTTLGEQSFANTSFTGNLIIPDSVTVIGRSSFLNCKGFTGTLTLGGVNSQLTTIGQGAFYECKFTGPLTIPGNVTTIGNDAFFNCTGFTGTLTLPNDMTTIKSHSFSGCSGFTGSLTIPQKVTSIEEAAFFSCTGFTGNLIIPDSVTSIDKGAFSGCTGLEGTLTLGSANSQLTTIGNSAFSEDKFIGELVIPDSVTSIGNNAFYECTGLTGTLVVGSGVQSIGNLGFYNAGFSDWYFLGDAPAFGDNVFITSNYEIRYPSSKSGTWDGLTKYTYKLPFTPITLTETSATIIQGNPLTITPTITPRQYKGAPTWASSDETIATVSDAGVVTGVRPGTANITATLFGETVTCAVTVEGRESEGEITVTYENGTAIPADGVVTGETVKLTLQVREKTAARAAFATEQQVQFYAGANAEGAKIGSPVTVNNTGTATVTYTIPDDAPLGAINFFAEYGMANVGSHYLKAGTASGSTTVAAVAEIGTTPYANFGAAITAANSSGGTIKLLRDSTYGGSMYSIIGTVTLDLAGKTLTMTNDDRGLFPANSSTKLTITGGGKLIHTTTSAVYFPEGTLIVENAAIESGATSLCAVEVEGTADVTINGGSFKGGRATLYVSSDTVKLTGGTFHKGSGSSISTEGTRKNVDTLLAPGYLYYADETGTGTVVEGNKQWLKQDVTVGKCKHPSWTDWTGSGDDYTRTCQNDCKADDATQTAAAKAGDNYYTTVQAAFDAVPDDATVTLLANSAEGLTTDKTFTLDLNNKNLTGANALTINGGKVTIQGTGTVTRLTLALSVYAALEGGTYGTITATGGTLNKALVPGCAFKESNGNWNNAGAYQTLQNVTVMQTPIKLTAQPQNVYVTYGYAEPITLSVTAEAQGGNPEEPIIYEWFSGDMTPVGAESTYTFPTGKGVGSYTYLCNLSRSGYTVQTSFGVVAVNPAPCVIENKDYATEYTYTGKPIPEPTAANFTATDGAGAMSFKWFNITGQPTSVGTYILDVTTEAGANVRAGSESFTVYIRYLETTEIATLSGTLGDNGWYTSDVIVTAPDGFTISTQNIDPNSGWGASTTITTDMRGGFTYYLKNAEGHITGEKTIVVYRDATAPAKPTLSYDFLTDTSVRLPADATDALSGVQEYTLTETSGNGVPAKTQTHREFNLSGLTPNTTYSFIVTAKDNAGNVSVASDAVTFTTNKASIQLATVTLSNHTGFTYDGSPKTPTVSVMLGDLALDASQYDVSYSDNVNAGTVTVTVTASADGDYSGTVRSQPTFTIAKGNPIVTWPTNLTAKYKQTLADVVPTGNGTGDGTFTWVEDSLSAHMVGSMTFLMYFNPTDSANYNRLIQDVTVTVGKGDALVAKPGTLDVVNNRAFTYSFDLAHLLTEGKTFGSPITYTVTSGAATSYYDEVTDSNIANGKLSLPVKAITSTDEGTVGTITVKVTSQNYEDMTATITVQSTNKIVPVVTVTGSYAYTYGQALSARPISGSATAGSTAVPGTLAWTTPAEKPTVGTLSAAWTFTPTDTALYTEVTGTQAITVAKANPSGTPAHTAINGSGKTLADANLGVGSITPVGTIDWNDAATTEVKQGAAYGWTFTPTDSANYNNLTGSITLWPNSSGGGGGGGGGSSDSNITVKEEKPNEQAKPIINATTETKATVGTDGKATVSVKESDLLAALAAAQKADTNQNGVSVTVSVTTDKAASSIAATLPQKAIDELVKAGVTELRIESKTANITLDLATLGQVQAAGGGNVTVSATAVNPSTLSKEAQAAIGSRPVFELSITAGGKAISEFGGEVSVALPYTPAAGENPGNLYGVYVDDAGKVTYLTNSSYNANAKLLRFSTNHFSTFGIGYKADAPKFTDTAGHWAKNDIDFVVSRGLFSGTSATTFAPDTSMTRGMFVTALGRLAQVETNKYTSSKFADVPATAYYAPYVAWASQNGIVNGGTDGKFNPDASITREQMAVIMSNYAKTIGFPVPKVHAENTFADSAKVSAYAKDAVKQMQMAGVLAGKSGNVFDPQGTATRAEVSAVLRRFIELTISTDTAQGWSMNDSGQWMYYENGKPVTGTKTVDGTAYTFDQNGVTADMPKNRRYTTYTVQKGDSFWAIAKKFNCTMAELEVLNGKSRYSIIYPGDELNVPEN